MPDPKGRRNRRDRDRERRRQREPRTPLSDEERRERDMRAALGSTDAPRRPATPSRASDEPIVLPSVRVRITGAMVGVLTALGAAYMVIAATLNGSGVDSIISIGAGVIMLGVGTFVVALVLFPKQIRDLVRGRR